MGFAVVDLCHGWLSGGMVMEGEGEGSGGPFKSLPTIHCQLCDVYDVFYCNEYQYLGSCCPNGKRTYSLDYEVET